ncbi:methyl-CpG-binding domain protein 1 isoform X14 [Marmota marmota marmota]|uniref:methyl-CpG-binding domain protein 1 isoform X14 n=1 Tax=Marmota marmota marmota TaxID=9994 RepID=UPI0020934C9B|nr:methyl-CpG-binding domain protein 1 isoform X14 [Marmota marmota marmota]
MAEDWLDCPALGPGWKRREVYRKSGVTCGRSDTYYQSPTGDRIRSKVELTRYLGPACDLTLFDFKQGILCYPTPKVQSVAVPSKKRKKPARSAKTRKRQVAPQRTEIRKERKERKETQKDETKADTDTIPASFPAPGCCENCGISFSGDGTGRQRLKTLCKDCRAQRIAFNREQRMFKRVGCGECTACRVTEDCGACSTCLLQLPHDVASGLFCKCERRRCLRIVQRGKRRCHRGGRDSKMAARRHSRAQPVPILPTLQPPDPPEPMELHNNSPVPSPPAEFIYYCVDEDELKRLLPSIGSESEEGAGSPLLHPRRKRPGSVQRPHLAPTLKPPLATRTARPGRAQPPMKQEAGASFVLPPPGTDLVFLREGASSPVQVPGPATASTEAPLQEAQCSGLSWVVALPQVKQEKADAQEEWTSDIAVLTSPTLQPGCPSKAIDLCLPSVKQEPPDPEEGKEENKDGCVSESAPEEEMAGGPGTPVITEIFSLGGTRFRDTAVWLPRLRKLLAVNENEYFTELQLKEEAL